MFVVTILLFLSSASWGHDLLKDAVLNMALELPRSSLASTASCQSDLNECSDEKFAHVMGGFHGHLLFGTGPFYLSHLPLYAPPHNYQAIYEVEFPLDAGALKIELKKKLASGGYATFEPSANPANREQSSMNFKIPQLTCLAKNSGDQIFWGEIHSGHFERPRSQKLGNAGLIIKRVVYYKELSPGILPEARAEADPKSAGEYIVFGHSGHYFASRVLGKRPGVDQIFPLRNTEAAQWVSVVGDLDHVKVEASPEKEGQRVFEINNKTYNVSISSFYTEVRELQ